MKYLFLIGAGFNIDANYLSGSEPEYFNPGIEAMMTHDNTQSSWEKKELPLLYPLVEDIRSICFAPDANRDCSVEELFSRAKIKDDDIILRRLTTVVQGADYYIASKIMVNNECPYFNFIQKFKGAHYISFNYDGLLDLCLFQQKQWIPHDGFGVPVEVEEKIISTEIEQIGRSTSLVLHPHGSINLDSADIDINKSTNYKMSWIERREIPLFKFDPDSTTLLYKYYDRPPAMFGYNGPERRIIPPVLDKRGYLKEPRFQMIMKKAISLVKESDILVSIGYSFADTDVCSYKAMLSSLFSDGKSLIVISPGAKEITERLYKHYNNLSPGIVSIPLTFAQWANHGFKLGA